MRPASNVVALSIASFVVNFAFGVIMPFLPFYLADLEGHISLPNPDAPSFICVDKRDGKVLWSDASPGANVLHGQWSSPGYAEVDGIPQVFFGGGDGWI